MSAVHEAEARLSKALGRTCRYEQSVAYLDYIHHLREDSRVIKRSLIEIAELEVLRRICNN